MSAEMTIDPIDWIAEELNLPKSGILAVVQLLNEGNTVPFIARYRKEMTGNLNEVHIRDIQEKYLYILDLEDRKKTILAAIEES